MCYIGQHCGDRIPFPYAHDRNMHHPLPSLDDAGAATLLCTACDIAVCAVPDGAEPPLSRTTCRHDEPTVQSES